MRIQHPFQNDIASVLRTLREKSGKSQKEVAKVIGTTSMSISHKELGRRGVRLGELEKWVDVLGYKVEIELLPKVKKQTKEIR